MSAEKPALSSLKEAFAGLVDDSGFNTFGGASEERPSPSKPRNPSREEVQVIKPVEEKVNPGTEMIEDPSDSFRKYLEGKYTFSKDDLIEVMDNLVINGGHEETFDIYRGKVSVTLRSRTVDDSLKISQYLSRQNFSTMEEYGQARSLITLAYTLVGYKGRDLHLVPVEGAASSREALIKSLSQPIMAKLVEKMEYFDFKIVKAGEEADEVF